MLDVLQKRAAADFAHSPSRDVKVPVSNIIGRENKGWFSRMVQDYTR